MTNPYAPQTPGLDGYYQQGPPPGYHTQQYPQYPTHQQGYPTQPAPPPKTGSLSGFFAQPSTGWGPAWSWTKPHPAPIGTTYVGMVGRPLQDGDIEQATEPNGKPRFYRDGREVWVMKVPLYVKASEQFADGRAQWYVQGQSRDELNRAMAEAGVTPGAPESGSVVIVTLTGERRNNFGTMSKIVGVRYLRPGPQADDYARQCGIDISSVVRGQGPVTSTADPGQPAPAVEDATAPLPTLPDPTPPLDPPQPPPAPVPAPAPPGQPPAPPVPPPLPPAAGTSLEALDDDQRQLLARVLQQQQS